MEKLILPERQVICLFPLTQTGSERESQFLTFSASGWMHVASSRSAECVGKLQAEGFIVSGVQLDLKTVLVLTDAGEVLAVDTKNFETKIRKKFPIVPKAPARLAAFAGRAYVSGFEDAVVEISSDLEISFKPITGVCVDLVASEIFGLVTLVETAEGQKISGTDFPSIVCPVQGVRLFCVDRKFFVFSTRQLLGYDGADWRPVELPFQIFGEEISDPLRTSSSVTVDRTLLNIGLKPREKKTVDRKFLVNISISACRWKNFLFISDKSRGQLVSVNAENFQVSGVNITDFPFPSGGEISVLPASDLLLTLVREGPVLVTDLSIGNFFPLKLAPFTARVLDVVESEISLSFGGGQPSGRFSAVFQNHCHSEIASWDFRLPVLPLKVEAFGSVALLRFPDGHSRSFEISDHHMTELDSDFFGSPRTGNGENGLDVGNFESLTRWNRKFLAGSRDGKLLILCEGGSGRSSRKKRKRGASPRLSPVTTPALALEREISVGAVAVKVHVLDEDTAVAISDSVVVIRKSEEISRVPLGVEIAHAVPIGDGLSGKNRLRLLVVTPEAVCHLFFVDVTSSTAEYHMQLPFEVRAGFRSEIAGNFRHFVLLARLEEAATLALVRASVDVTRLGAHGLDEALEISASLALNGVSEILDAEDGLVLVCAGERLLAVDATRSFRVVAKAGFEEQRVKFLRKISGNTFLVGSSDSVAVVELVRNMDDEDAWKFQVVCTLPTQHPIVDAACRKSGNFQVLLAHASQGCSLWDLESRKCLGEMQTTFANVQNVFPLTADARVLVVHGERGLALLDAFAPDDAGLLHVEELSLTSFRTPVTAFAEDDRQVLLATGGGGLIAVSK